MDTHRLWEVLYLGGIPIVLHKSFMAVYADELPIVVVNDWQQLEDTNFLESKHHELSAMTFNVQALNVDTWIDEISNYSP